MNLKQKQFLDSYVGLPLIYFHIVAAKILGLLLQRNHNINLHPKEICIVKLLGFGSIVMASDAIYSVKIKYPGSTLSVICSKGIEEGIRSLQLFDKVYVINDSNFFTLISSALRIICMQLFRSRLWIADLEVYSKLTSILTLWTRALNRFGFYFNQVAFRYNMYTHKVYFNTAINIEDNYTQIVMAMGVTNITRFTIPGFPPRLYQKDYPFIALNNTCSELAQERRLTDEQLIMVCNWIINNTTYKIALLGAPTDAAYNVGIIKQGKMLSERVVNYAGRYTFEDYYGFLYNECAIIVTIDSAPLHIANKLNIPNLSIWGPTSPQSRINTDNGNLFIYHGVKCSPCTHFIDKLPCNGNNFCIKNITTEQIAHNIMQLLNSKRPNEQ